MDVHKSFRKKEFFHLEYLDLHQGESWKYFGSCPFLLKAKYKLINIWIIGLRLEDLL